MSGIHHVTAIAGDPQKNFSFYTRDLGLRFVKKTVNFDDPATYHFYYGDETGRPGSILTFFPWEGAPGGPPRCRRNASDDFPRPTTLAGLLDAALPREGDQVRGDREALR